MKILFPLLLVVACLLTCPAWAQQKDSSKPRMSAQQIIINSDSLRKAHSPRTAAIRSAILPGLGQIYNRKYWKLPLVYGALGITGGIFNYNLHEYRKVRFAYFTLLNNDTANFPNVATELQPFIAAGSNGLNSLRTYRNEFRKNIDYSVLFFLLFWGLNVVDATVDAHLKGFDVGRELSLQLRPSLNTIPNGVGLSMVFSFKTPTSKWANTTPAP